MKNKTVLITGAARRVGASIAKKLSELGMNVVIHYNKSKEEANILAKDHQIKTIYCDFSKIESIKSFFQKVQERFGDIDILIHNASHFQNGDIHNTTIENWEEHININLTTPFILTQSFLKNSKQKQKKIIGMVDRRALNPGKKHLAYTVSESGLVSLLEITSNTHENITTGLVVMGPILPPKSGTLEEFHEQIEKSPEKKAGTLEDVSLAVIRIIKSKNDKIKIAVACKIDTQK